MALMKLCRCGKKIEYSVKMCAECEKKYQEQQKDSNLRYDKYKRDRRSTDFYHSTQWVQLRTVMLNKFNYIDVYEYIVNHRIVQATTVHHIIPIKEDWSRRLDVSNLIPVSEKTHNKLHGMYKYQKQKTQEKLFKAMKEYMETIKG